MSTSSVSRTERLLNLVIALLAARAPVSRASIQATVAGYDSDASVPAFERMFERDKEELRGMGIPIRTVTDAHGDVQGYVIDADEYATEDLQLTAEEIAVLNIAAQLWDDAVLESAALTAVRKLESAAEAPPTSTATFGVLTAREAALLPLMRAVRDGRVTRFPYRKPGASDAERRTVEPWLLRSHRGHWYLVGFDRDKGQQRTFRISRIDGPVQILAESTGPHPREWQESGDDGPADEITVELVIPPGVGGELRRMPGARSSDDVSFTVLGERDRILTLVWRAHPSVRLTSPDDLRAAYRAGLERIVRGHE